MHSLPGGVLATQTVIERMAAVAYLRAARLTADAVERERLRRRGADLLWPARTATGLVE